MASNNFERYKETVDSRIKELLDLAEPGRTIGKAMRYSMTAGGKRLRPILNIMANSLFDGDTAETLDIACAIEMIHTYSLIHDDLPAMDDDELRRGNPTCHVVFGEGIAVLAGDAFLNYAFETMLANAERFPDNMPRHIKAMSIIAKAAGIFGMIGGQCSDLEAVDGDPDKHLLDYIHEHKTGAMIVGSLLSGAVLCNPGQTEMDHLKRYGECIGKAFQIIDDILDIQGDPALLGKTTGKDADDNKLTFPKLYGISDSYKMASDLTEEAVECLDIFGTKAADLAELAEKILNRKK